MQAVGMEREWWWNMERGSKCTLSLGNEYDLGTKLLHHQPLPRGEASMIKILWNKDIRKVDNILKWPHSWSQTQQGPWRI